MHDDVAEIDQHPFTGIRTLDTERSVASFLALHGDIFRQGLHVAIGVAAADHEVVHHVAELANVEGDCVNALHVVEGIVDQISERLGAQIGLLLYFLRDGFSPS